MEMMSRISWFFFSDTVCSCGFYFNLHALHFMCVGLFFFLFLLLLMNRIRKKFSTEKKRKSLNDAEFC